MHKSLPFTELCALYAVSDVCLVTSTRDGMNLVRRSALLATHLPQPVWALRMTKFSIGLVRIYRFATGATRSYDYLGVRGCRPKFERQHRSQPMG